MQELLSIEFTPMNKTSRLSHNWLIIQINNNILKRCYKKLRGRVIDLGCGTAPYKTDIFANLCEPLPIEDLNAGTVISSQVMEHLPGSYTFLKEAHRIFRPDGTIIKVPFMWHVHEAPHDYYRFIRYSLEYLLKKAGVIDVAVTENTGYWQMSVLKFNYYTASFARGPLRWLFIPIWYAGRRISPFLDNLHWVPTEAASYAVTAKKL